MIKLGNRHPAAQNKKNVKSKKSKPKAQTENQASKQTNSLEMSYFKNKKKSDSCSLNYINHSILVKHRKLAFQYW